MLINLKKAQITIFILLGLALFAIVSLSIYFSMSTQTISETQAFRRTPTSFRDYVEICLEEVSRTALLNVGFQGGYIELPFSMRMDSDSFLRYDSQGFFGVPAWFYKGSFRIPSLTDIELEISSVVERDLNICLDEFSGFRESYDVIEKSPLFVVTTISDDAVFVEAEYEIDVISRSSDQTESFSVFTHNHDVKLGTIHELAKRIVHSEVENTNFENAMIDLIAANPDIPLTHMSFSAKPESWYVENIIREIELMIFYNMQLVRFRGTNHPPFEAPNSEYEKFRGLTVLDLRQDRIPEGRPYDAYEYFNLFFDPNDLPDDYDAREISFSDIGAAVKYHPNRNLNVNVNPSTAGVMRTNMARFPGTPIPFPVQVGHFTYDVNYMVEINLFDENAFSGNGYLFRFALPVSVKSNEPNKEYQGFSLSSAPSQFTDPCDETEGLYTIQVTGMKGGMTDIVLDGVDVSYDCIIFGCYLGSTAAEQGTYMLSTGLPSACSGGFINLEKEGYLSARQQHLGNDEIIIEMQKVEEFDVIVDVRHRDHLFLAEPLRESLTAILRVTPEKYGEEQVFVFDASAEPQKITLLADNGKYLIDLLLIEDIDDDTDWIIGGYKGVFEYDYSDTFLRNELVVSAVEVPIVIPFTPERQFEVMEFIEQGSYLEEVKPRFR